MVYTTIYTIVINLGLLVMAAQIMTRFRRVKSWLIQDKLTAKNMIALIIIFAMFGIGATLFGTPMLNGIVNVRVVVSFTSGLLFGPVVGIASSIISAMHRYYFDPTDLTAIACSISTIVAGAVGGMAHKKRMFFPFKYKNAFLAMVLVEIIEIILIFIFSHPFEHVVDFAINVFSIMFILNCLGTIVFLSVFEQGIVQVELDSSKKVIKTFSLADMLLPLLRKGFNDKKSLKEAVDIIARDKDIHSVLILDKDGKYDVSSENSVDVDYEIINNMVSKYNGNPEILPRIYEDKDINYVCEVLVQGNVILGFIVILFNKNTILTKSSLEYTNGLAKIMSTQLELAQIDINKEKLRQSEYEMLQYQINPHFLFNILNTIVSVSRKDVDKARQLLIDLSIYFRGVLKKRDIISIDEELDNIRVYFELEKARFGDQIALEINNDNNVNVNLPKFILQPIVENAIKHGLRTKENGKIVIDICEQSQNYMIVITDNGKGMSYNRINEILIKSEKRESIGVSNVNERLINYYGEQYKLVIESEVDKFTKVIIKLPKQEVKQ